MDFKFKKLSIPDLIIVTPQVFNDERGIFMETYKKSAFEKVGIKENFIQDNHSSSKKNVLRGLHYQIPPMEQAKLVRCIKGEVFDVAVDLRKGSPYFGKWAGDYLSEENRKMIFIPAGFAHGYLVLSEEADISYKVNKEYSKEHDRGIFWKDTTVRIEWPLYGKPILSDKDKKLPLLKDIGEDFRYELKKS
ncbi:dTDP-4-dehydrorhamnose 3,5-epimerase [candidate division WOR-3 bacterium]|nr:dTDP-4-dehydrorhamnose 3,5-epimerase [candidate division WOR-3 bacterium]